MKNLSNSAFIFDLIDDFQIFDLSGRANEFTDESFNAFCEKYSKLSEQRDLALLQYVNSTPSLFRTHLPHSKWSIAVAFNVVWYYDELIITDPVLQFINDKELDGLDLEKKKSRLQQLLTFLKNCRESIEGGFFLFSGNDIPQTTQEFLKKKVTH
jgi:hypothetical protein